MTSNNEQPTLISGATAGSEPDSRNVRPERISSLSRSLSRNFDTALKEIDSINLQTRLLSFNAQVEAARAGHYGASFSVVASEMQKLSTTTGSVARRLEREAKSTVGELERISAIMANNVRGIRLSDMALVNIDLIDRNLYERTCDVRWWATDSAVVDALEKEDPALRSRASKRLGVILDAYTVYFDIVLCDLEGRVIANGRPGRYRSQGSSAKERCWFQQAMRSRSGDEYGFESVTANPLVDNQLTLVYSCGVRAGGEASGRLIGALGIVFNWSALAQVIMDRTPVEPSMDKLTRRCIVDGSGAVLADSFGRIMQEPLNLRGLEGLMQKDKSFIRLNYDGKECFVGHARSPGYETYATGWHSVIIEPIVEMEN